MDMDREVDRLMKRIEQKVAEPEIIFAAIKQLAVAHFAGRAPTELSAFNHFMDMSLQRRLSGPGLAVLTNDIKRRIAALEDRMPSGTPAQVVTLRPRVHWL
jgi:hypothetical protein